MSWPSRLALVLAAALLGPHAARAACPALTVNFFPKGTTNVPQGWTQAAQEEAGNEDTSSLNTITLAPTPIPKLFVQPEHPFFTKKACVPADCLPAKAGRRLAAVAAAGSTIWQLLAPGGSAGERALRATCLTTVAAPAGYQITYNIDGGINKKAVIPPDSPPYIQLNTLDTLAPGKHTLNIKVTMLKGTAEVNSVASLQPDADQEFTTKVTFKLDDAAAAEEEEPAAPAPGKAKPAAAAAAAAAAGAAAAGAKGAAEPPAAAADETDTAADVVEPAATGAAGLPPAEPVDQSVTAQATKYYCLRQYNVGGRIHSNKSVTVGDAGVTECSVACNALGATCAGFGLTGKKCFLMKSFNTNSSAADATMDALCMKSPNDWLDFGGQNAERVSAGFFCLRGYDLKGDPASSGDAEAPVQSANTEIAGMTPSTCATACKGTAGCQFMIIKKPATPGGTSTCYLKMHPLGGQYGTTGPSADTDFTCFNGQDTWVTFGGQLDYFLPSPVVNTGVETPALASITPTLGASNDTGAKTYRCIKQYSINGTVLGQAQVSMGDEGLTQCAGKCDEAQGKCAAYTMHESGVCTMLSSIDFTTSAADARTYGLCFASPLDWNKFGNPDPSGMYCVKHYDFAGDGVRTVDYITITTGSGAIQFCKQQCSAEPQCQYSVTSLGKCYMKNNILSGSFGTTRPDTAVDASCVKGENNWALAALQVSAAPPMPIGAGAANLTARRQTALASSAGGPGCRASGWALLLAGGLLAALPGGWLRHL